jgi:inhibitor of KinA sporulation pathway (predicted exonuclease)
VEMDGREHHALDDARHQAREIAATLARLDGGESA